MLYNMNLTDISPAIALTPLDGRYHQQTAPLVEYLSEPALNRERMRVEVEWMILLANGFEGNGFKTIVPGIKPLTDEEQAFLRAIPEDFGAEGIAQHAAHEAVTHHDVKAVEYYIDDQLDKAAEALGHETQLTELKTLVHFACTSEDINNLSIARCVKNGIENVWLPGAQAIVDHLAEKAEEYRDKAMLSLTHGQPATPTTLGKELAVYVYRLSRQLNKVRNQEYLGKINGATGTFGAHLAACPYVDWVAVSREFVTNRMGLTWNPLTTQIESHDWQAELYADVARAGRIDLPAVPADCGQNAHMFYIKLRDNDDRAALINWLKEAEILAVFHYIPLHDCPAGDKFGVFAGVDRFTTKESERLLRLPLFYNLSPVNQRTVISTLLNYFA